MWARIVPVAYSLALALLVVGPLLGPGYLLLRDGVSTPRSYPTDAALGLGDAAPRAVPQDGLLAALSVVVDGGIVVKAILVLALTATGWGAARLAHTLLGVSLAPRLVAATVAIWNPYVAERLLQGHWSLLAGYAALPWTVVLGQRIRAGAGRAHPATRDPGTTTARADVVRAPRGDTSEQAPGNRTRPGWVHAAGSWAMLGGVLAAAGVTPTGSLLAGLMAVLTVGRRNLVATVALWLVSAGPWLVATALSGSGAEPSDPAGVAAFAARAEPGLGTLGSLAGLGGIWNGDAVSGSRTTLFAVVSTLVLLAVVGSGVRAVAAAGDPSTRYPRRMTLVLAAVCILLPALGATGWGLSLGESLIARIPGAGLLRDTQKYVALAMPAYTLCAAAGCHALASFRRRASEFARQPAPETDTVHADAPAESAAAPNTSAAQPLLAALFIAALILTLPDLAWGVGGALRPVHYPPAWQRVAAMVEGPGDVAVLPAGMFRVFPYSGRVPVLDPAPRMLRSDVLQTGVLPVRGRVVAGEGARAQRVENLLLRGADPADLAAQGVGWILVEHRTPGTVGEAKTTLSRLQPVYSDADLTLYRVPGARDVARATAADRTVAIAAHALWATLLLAGLAAALADRRRER
ncbi:hypothetical protein [Nocardia africana]|uniref:Transmembrane protein n=1 Tax=Nocardia africana TaxID=134964 RepID=A0A378WK12_9NOCA|nr:hypothetical protein [Nocardia africana]MCC3318044.1 hypothetical protein [Nocardia africana]SUA40771.1 Uncharacterised protein [Nocardia africana]